MLQENNFTNNKSIEYCVELAIKREHCHDWWGCMCVRTRVSGLWSVLNTTPGRATGETQEKYENFVKFKFWLQSQRYTIFPPHGAPAPSGPGPSHCRGFTITLRHTTLCRTPLDEWSARRRDLYLTTLNTHNRQTSTPPAGFEPTVCTSE